jgi:thiol-disulfide isomerase/thioredoxin
MYCIKFVTFSILISLLALKGFSQADGMFGGNELDFLMSKKPAKLIIFSANWCLPCKVARKEMQQNVKLRRIVESYDMIIYDFDADKDAKKKYNISKVPTYIIEVDGVEVKRQVGYGGTKKLIDFLD